MTDKTLSVYMPALSLAESAQRYNALVEFTRSVRKPGTDFGVIPGTGTKPTLLKPGAEKLCTLFGLSPEFQMADKLEDWGGTEHGGEPLFMYRYACKLYRGAQLMGSGEGSCNSWEKKYRYRKAERTCPKCGKQTIIKGKVEYGGGWLCFAKRGGCGTKFKDGDESIESQSTDQGKNPDVAEQVNTMQKMAQKRALVAATLIAVNASEFFTQDIEDMTTIEGSWTEAEVQPHPPVEQVVDQRPKEELLDFDMALTELGKIGLGREALVEALKAQGHKGYKTERDTATVRRLLAENQPQPA